MPVTDKVTIVDDPESIVCVVAVPKEEAAPVVEEVAAVTAAEPEVIQKGKEAGEASDAKDAQEAKDAQ